LYHVTTEAWFMQEICSVVSTVTLILKLWFVLEIWRLSCSRTVLRLIPYIEKFHSNCMMVERLVTGPVTVEAWVQTQASPCGICGW